MKVLKPLAHATTLLCVEKRPSPSIMQPVLTALEKQHLVTSHLEPNLALHMKNTILTNMKAHFSDAEQRKVIPMASALDPRYKTSKFLKTAEKDAVYENITDAVAAFKGDIVDIAEVIDLLDFAESSALRESSNGNGSSPLLHFRNEIEREVHYYRAE